MANSCSRREVSFNRRLAVAALVLLATAFSGTAQVFTNLHSFVFLDGTSPVAKLLLTSNTLYGTTRTYGGGNAGGYGSVFRMNTDGSAFTNLHTFSAIQPEGGNMNGGVLLLGDTLYTTATFGGSSNYGCVVAISTNGLNETNLYNFPVTSDVFPYANSDGAYPSGGLEYSGGTLYGVAGSGGAYGWGALYWVSTNGTAFTNLHSFNFTDGQYPGSDLLLSNGVLYGTTFGGGAGHVGTIFRMNTNGAVYTNFYDFTQPNGSPQTNDDGAFPACSLVLSGDTLYGTAAEGGNSGSGTVFMIKTNGTGFSVLHQFTSTNNPSGTNMDGAAPKAGLLLLGNALYGTASAGGSAGNGTVFRINTDGSGFATLYHFTGTNNVAGTNLDGAHPLAALITSGGILYGTASAGGTGSYGTVFSIATPPVLSITAAGTNAILSWPPDFAGYNLQSATNLNPPITWDALAGQYSVTNPATGREKFYRLMHP